MFHRKRKPRKVCLSSSIELINRLFRCLSEDLGVSGDPSVSRAAGQLAAKQYRGFLDTADSWATQQYGSANETFAWNQLSCLLKKVPFTDQSIDPGAAAMKKFFQAEHRCKRVNARFRARRKRLFNRPHESHLHEARRWIKSVIGLKPNYEKIYDRCDFGPGASVGVSGTLTHPGQKLGQDKWTVTRSCAPFARAALSGDSLIWEHLLGAPYCVDYDLLSGVIEKRLDYVEANNIALVPKTAKVHRTIAIEPSLNGYVQKGADLYLRDKLFRVGIDLSDQSRNQRLAREGSLGGSNPFVTIDLSSASDTISIELVKELLPPDWFEFLNAIRSPSFNYDGGCFRYEKFSSMGNGFSFPLETLIFASIVHAAYVVTGDSEFAVYGDDIIVRQRSAALVLELLKYCGFSSNTDKTFLFGPFRESCGADFFEGVNVRPYYLDALPDTIGKRFSILNGLRRAGLASGAAWRCVFDAIPPEWQFLRPFDGDDTAITVELDVFMSSPFSRFNRAQHRWMWRSLAARPVYDMRRFSDALVMYGLLRGVRSNGPRIGYTHRRKTVTKVRYM